MAAPGDLYASGSYSGRGLVHVFRGTTDGVSTRLSQTWGRRNPGLPGARRPDEVPDCFGLSLAPGDFDGDGFGDLAIADPCEHRFLFPDASRVGSVTVLYGSPAGLLTTGATRLDWTNVPFDHVVGTTQLFGVSLVAGDYNGDGRDELTVATAPSDENPSIWTFSGSPSGVLAENPQQRLPGDALGTPADGFDRGQPGTDGFGAALASGDIDGDHHDDLVVGAPEAPTPTLLPPVPGSPCCDGAVFVLPGSPMGLTSTGARFLSKNSPGVPGSVADTCCQAASNFGAALAVGDLDRDGHADVAIGAPHDSGEGIADAGSLTVLRGSALGVTTAGARRITEATRGVPGRIADQGGFGASHSPGDFDGDGYGDLAVGVPRQHLSTAEFGNVLILRGAPSPAPVLGGTPQGWNQNSAGVPGTNEHGDLFGSAVYAVDFDADRRSDLVVGVPGENLASGNITVLPGAPGGVSTSRVRWISQDSAGVAGVPEPGDRFGASLG